MASKTKYIISTSKGFDFECNNMQDAEQELIKHSNNHPKVQMAIWKLVKTRTAQRGKPKT